MGQTTPFTLDALPYSTEEFVLDLLKTDGPDVLVDIALKCLALAVATGRLEINSLIQFTLGVQQHADMISDHFRDAGARSGSFGLPRA